MTKENKDSRTHGRITLPSEENFYDETLELIDRLGVDVLRDSDGTKLPDELKDLEGISVYTKYLTARGFNDFALKNFKEITRFYLMSEFVTAYSDKTEIEFAKEYFDQQVKPDYDHDPKEWWEVIDRTTGKVVDPKDWEIDQERNVAIINTIPFHEYTVSFLAYCIWDPVHMYNFITNDWPEDTPHAIPLDVRYDSSADYMEKYLDEFLANNLKTDVIRFTTFFYQFSLIFNKHGLEKHVDWFGYTNSVSPKAFKEFEEEYGYKLRPEDIVDEGYYNSTYRVPSKTFKDYIEFTSKKVRARAKRLVDIVHKHNRKAIMFLGDQYIGIEPWSKGFEDIGLDGVVGSVGDGLTLRLISSIETPMTEGRFLPYFFPDTFYEGNDPTIEGKDNWVKARRALVREPLDRIGYGGYMSLAYKFPKFIDYIEKVAQEFRDIHDIVSQGKALSSAKVAILNHWGSRRKWGPWTVAHGKWYKLAYSYQGILEALSGMDMDVVFIDFQDVKNGLDKNIDVIINAGDAYTAFSGGQAFLDEEVVSTIREFVYQGGGFIGVGEPSAIQKDGRYFQLADVLGVDKEIGFSLSNNKYFEDEVESHFITEDLEEDLDFGEGKQNIYSISENTQILKFDNNQVHMATNDFGKGRSFYITGLPYSTQNTRLLKRAIHYVAHKEDDLKKYYADDLRVEVAAFPNLKKYAVINNSLDPVTTKVYDKEGKARQVEIDGADLIWIEE